jgi:Asp-tRNA(Asn)/Glu-tRNA(Gln) amidotransferase B subunit
MNEHRRQILEMLSAGKITADEAERLIAALEKEPASQGGTPGTVRPSPKYLRVIVDADELGDAETLTKINIRVPLQLLRAGVKLASLIPQDAREHVNEALREKGVAFDMSQLKPENLEELIEQLNDLTVDVDHAKGQVRVKVFCE